MVWRSTLPFSSAGLAPGQGIGSRSRRAASRRNIGRTSSAVSARRYGFPGAAAHLANSGKTSSTPCSCPASQARETFVGSGSSLLSSTMRSVRWGNSWL